MEKYKQDFMEKIRGSEDIFTDVDGFYYFWTNDGCLASHHLRWIADELDRLNETLNQEIEEYFRKNPPV